MEHQEQQSQQVSNYSVNDIHDICDKYVRRYFEHQKTDILTNLRIFARHDREINYFMDRIMEELSKELKKYKKEAIEEIREKIDKHNEKYDNRRNNAIIQIDNHLNNRISQIIAKEPYDIISSKFLDKLEKKLYSEYHEKVANTQFVCLIMIIINIVLLVVQYFKLF